MFFSSLLGVLLNSALESECEEQDVMTNWWLRAGVWTSVGFHGGQSSHKAKV